MICARVLVMMGQVRQDDELSWKLLAARLYNLGFQRQGWPMCPRCRARRCAAGGWRCQSGDPERLRKALSGQGAERKLTLQIEAFVRFRFRVLLGHMRAFAMQIIAEVKTIFNIPISASRLHSIVAEGRAKLAAAAESASSAPVAEEVQPQSVARAAVEAPTRMDSAPSPPRSERKAAEVARREIRP